MRHVVTIVRLLFLAVFLFLIVKGKMMLWLGLFAISLLVALLFGRVYCGYVCPMNTLMIPAERLSNRLKIRKIEGEPKFLRSGIFPWFALIASVAAVVISKKFWQTNIPILPLWLVISLLVTLKYHPAVFHNLICPFGVLQQIFGKYARFSNKVIEQNCTGCRRCEKTCPSEAIKINEPSRKAIIDTALCFQCTNCKQVCKKDAIRYTKTKTIENATRTGVSSH
jgi:ferredoxin-type protein NapH